MIFGEGGEGPERQEGEGRNSAWIMQHVALEAFWPVTRGSLTASSHLFGCSTACTYIVNMAQVNWRA